MFEIILCLIKILMVIQRAVILLSTWLSTWIWTFMIEYRIQNYILLLWNLISLQMISLDYCWLLCIHRFKIQIILKTFVFFILFLNLDVMMWSYKVLQGRVIVTHKTSGASRALKAPFLLSDGFGWGVYRVIPISILQYQFTLQVQVAQISFPSIFQSFNFRLITSCSARQGVCLLAQNANWHFLSPEKVFFLFMFINSIGRKLVIW